MCVLRLSALGDCCHVAPVVRTLQEAWPGTQFTWVIGKVEARLLTLMRDVEFIIVDKRAGWRTSRAQLLSRFGAGRRPDLLLHMQLALRASVLSTAIPAPVKLGFDLPRARELQWAFTNRRIAAKPRQHVLDGLFGFAEAMGVRNRAADWSLPLPQEALDYARRLIPGDRPTLLVSPCSSHALRNWASDRYAAIVDHATFELGMQVILCGGPSDIEKRTGAEIVARCRAKPLNQIGADTLPQMQALLARANALIAPDSGPVHMATLAATPVLGLYAATNPRRSGPYRSREWCVNRFDDAARRYTSKDPATLHWMSKFERPDVMDLITIEDVKGKLAEMATAGLLSLPRE